MGSSTPVGIALTDFVVRQPLFPWHDERPPLLPLLAELVRTLHQGPVLPQGESIFAKAETILGWLPAAFQAAPLVVEAGMRLAKLAPVVRDPVHLRPGHGDINPGNLLFDGTQLWLIDWAAAGQENFDDVRNAEISRSENIELTFCFQTGTDAVNLHYQFGEYFVTLPLFQFLYLGHNRFGNAINMCLH